MDVQALGVIVLVVGSILCVIGVAWFAIVAFRESVLWGLGCLFLPVVSLIFLIAHWRVAAKPFGVSCLGQVIIVVALLMILPHGYTQDDEWRTLDAEAMSLYREGHYDRAIVVAKKALEVAEQAGGPDHPNIAKSLNNLAALYRAQGQYAQAEPLCRRSLAIMEKALGPDHPDVALSLENLAALYRATNRMKEAEVLEKRAAAIRAITR